MCVCVCVCVYVCVCVCVVVSRMKNNIFEMMLRIHKILCVFTNANIDH